VGILIILDHYSKFTFLKPLRSFLTKHILTYLKENIFDCFGVPEVIITDNGSQFRSKDFQSFLEKFGVQHTLTAVYSPQSNASERVNRCINEALRSYLRKGQRDWDEYISSINCSLRNSLHTTIGKSPYQIVFGQNMICHGKDYQLLRNLNLLTEATAELNRTDQFALLRKSIQSKIEAAYKKNTRTYNLRSRPRSYEIGDEVIRRNFAQSNMATHFNAKLAPVGIRARVKAKKGQSLYVLEDMQGKEMGTYHAKDIWPA